MDRPFSFVADALTEADRSALRRLADRLWDVRGEVAAEWARRLTELLPEYFPAGGVSVGQLAVLNESVLSLVLERIRCGELPGLYEEYYGWTRRLIDADVRRAPALRISLVSLYTSARVSLSVIGERLGRDDDRLMLAYTKLTAQLMMLVGRAYSDSREEYLQRVFEQINVLSHELRAPLSHLFAYLEMLRAGDFGTVSPAQEQILGQLIHETDDLLWLLTGTLDLSRLDTGQVDVPVEVFSLPAVVAEVVSSSPHLKVPVTCAIPGDLPLLQTDRVKVKQILGNLVRNAVRYGGGPVVVTAAVPRPGCVEVSVRDHGPGIRPEELGIIFDFFQRGSAVPLARDGYGIGLHVVRRLVQLLGGTVEVESVLGQGSCFRVSIPVQAPGRLPAGERA